MYRQAYYFVHGLLYPGALGASLTWFVQCFTQYASNLNAKPGYLAIFAALWFTIYHGALFVKGRVHAGGDDKILADGYNRFSFISDILDSAALFIALGSIGFPSEGPSNINYIAMYIAAFLVPISAMVADKDRVKAHKILIVVVLLVCLVPIIVNLLANEEFLKTVFIVFDFNSWVILVLWGLLFIYLRFFYPN